MRSAKDKQLSGCQIIRGPAFLREHRRQTRSGEARSFIALFGPKSPGLHLFSEHLFRWPRLPQLRRWSLLHRWWPPPSTDSGCSEQRKREEIFCIISQMSSDSVDSVCFKVCLHSKLALMTHWQNWISRCIVANRSTIAPLVSREAVRLGALELLAVPALLDFTVPRSPNSEGSFSCLQFFA